MKNFSTLILTLIAIISFLACRPANTKNDKYTKETSVIAIDTFSIFPPEIDGCSCYFANDSLEFKNHEYIYVNDFAQTSFMKVEGVMTKFTQVEFKEIDKDNVVAKYKSENYVMTIEVKAERQNGDETWLKSGRIVITDKTGKTQTKTFYGECGC